MLLALLLCAGCAGAPLWQKAGVSPEETETDIVTCHRQADRQAEEEAFGGRGGPNTAVIEIDRARGITRDVQSSARRTANLSEKARRGELFRDCMLAKGYRPERR